MRTVTTADVTLSPDEVKDFLHNAQLTLCDLVADDRIPAVYYAKEKLKTLFTGSIFSPSELACLLVLIAWDVMEEKNGPGD